MKYYVKFFFSNASGGITGLTPTIKIRDVSDNTVVVDTEDMEEAGEGAYKYYFPERDVTREYVGYVDGGAGVTGTQRYGHVCISSDEVSGRGFTTGAIAERLLNEKIKGKTLREILEMFLELEKPHEGLKKLREELKKEIKKIKPQLTAKDITKLEKNISKELAKIEIPDMPSYEPVMNAVKDIQELLSQPTSTIQPEDLQKLEDQITAAITSSSEPLQLNAKKILLILSLLDHGLFSGGK